MTITLSNLNQGAPATVPLPVSKGGSGLSSISGVLVGGGAVPFAAAVPGVDIKTIGGVSLLGAGDIPVTNAATSIYLANNFGGF